MGVDLTTDEANKCVELLATVSEETLETAMSSLKKTTKLNNIDDLNKDVLAGLGLDKLRQLNNWLITKAI
jgi:hypothetical protein